MSARTIFSKGGIVETVLILYWHYIAGAITGIGILFANRKWIIKILSAIKYVVTRPVRVVEELSVSIENLTHVVAKSEASINARIDGVIDVIKEIKYEASTAEAKTRLLFEKDPTPRFECDLSGQCIWSNTALQKLFGLNKQEMLGVGWLAALHPEDIEKTKGRWMETVHNWYPYRARYRLFINEKITPVEATAEVLTDGHGTTLSIWGKVEVIPHADHT